jgi:hypothetical protein
MQSKLEHFRQTIAEVGREQAVLKLSRHYSREEVSFLMDQLDGQLVAQEKFPSLAVKEGLTYPPSFYLEQTSSEKTARFKASLVQGQSLIDMTGGFGIDAYFFSQKIPGTWYVEQDPVIYNIASGNLKLLNPAIKTINRNSIEFLQKLENKVDWLYLDPIRRTKEKRLSKIEEYSPNIIGIRELLFKRARNVMIKLSPMTDISQAVSAIGDHVHKVYVLATDNECKELLLILDENEHSTVTVESIHWIKEKEERFVSILNEKHPAPELSEPLTYLYEPNAAIFKSQQYDEQAARYSLFKLHPNTHLYTSQHHHSSYEGKIYKIAGIHPFDARAFRKSNPNACFNIKTRNFPLTPAEVAKKLSIKEGGDQFLFCVKAKDERLKLIACDRL